MSYDELAPVTRLRSTMLDGLLDQFQSLSFDTAPVHYVDPIPVPPPTYVLPSRSSVPRLRVLHRPRPPTPPPSRRPPKPNAPRRSTRLHHKRLPIHTDRLEAAHAGKRVQGVWQGRTRADGESVPRDRNKRTRFIMPDSEGEGEEAWMGHPTNITRRTSGPLRSILRNKHAGTTPYQKGPVRHAVRRASVP